MVVDGKEGVCFRKLYKRAHLRSSSANPQDALLVVQYAESINNQSEPSAIDIVHACQVKHHTGYTIGNRGLYLRVHNLERCTKSKRPLKCNDRNIIGKPFDIYR